MHVKNLMTVFYKHLPRYLKSDYNLVSLEYAALLHDIGKLGMPEEILNKEGQLNEEEEALMRTHPQVAVRLLRSIKSFDYIADWILYHHERIDGTDDAAEENEATLDSLLNTESGEVEILADDGLPKKERVKNVEVGSVAEAYCEVEDGSAKKLFPCLSYASTVNLEDGGKVSRIIDVPHSRGSWHHNRKGKKPVKFHRFNH